MKSKKIQLAIQAALMAQLKETNEHIKRVLWPALTPAQQDSTEEILKESMELMWVIERLDEGRKMV